MGYRKLTPASTGTWVARYYDGETQTQRKKSLGELADVPAAERYDAARREADTWFRQLGRAATLTIETVGSACRKYVQHLIAHGRTQSAHDAEMRFRRWVYDTPFGRTELPRLKPASVGTWRATLAATPSRPQDKAKEATRPRSASSLNRDMTPLRAALNFAVENGATADSSAWKVKLRPIKNADGRRDVYLDGTQRKSLIAKAQPDFGALCEALNRVPLRPGAMAKLRAKHFDSRLSTLAIGKDKGGRERRITLPPATAAFFVQQAGNKGPDEPLLARADGQAWNKDSWKHPFKEAAKAAELPAESTLYSLRHSTITDLIVLHKLDTLTVSQLSGTSLAMIEKHYGHLLRDHAADALARLAA